MKRKLFLLGLMIALTLSLVLPSAAFADLIDTTGPTGTYYQYGVFSTYNSPFIGGQDVDSYGDLIYVNRDGDHLDVYKVTLNDTDGDGLYEPDQHPNNQYATGPMEQRTLTYVQTYDIPQLDYPSIGEIYAAEDRVYFLGEEDPGDVYEYVFSTGVTNKVVDATGYWNWSHLGYDEVNNEWYASNEGERAVYKWDGSNWVKQFIYSDLAGSHMDGLEVVTDPSTNIPYVYVSDMTSNYIGQWKFDKVTNTWVEKNLFAYNDVNGDDVEGMGFGALGHFWVTGWDSVYEIGGGDLSPFTSDLSLSPLKATNVVGSTHNVTATACLNQKPVEGITVTFTITGAHNISGTATTDSNGQATFAYKGSVVGTDTIAASANINGKEVASQLATCEWSGNVGPVIMVGKITGGGWIDAKQKMSGKSFGFVSEYTDGDDRIKGDVEFNNHQTKDVFHSTEIETQTIDKSTNTAMVTGKGRLNGETGHTFKLIVSDKGEPGAGVDTFEIYVDGTLIGSNILEGGNIQIHK